MDILGPFFIFIALAIPTQPNNMLFWADNEVLHTSLEECQDYGRKNEVPLALTAVLTWQQDYPKDTIYPIGWKCTTQKEINQDPSLTPKSEGVAI